MARLYLCRMFNVEEIFTSGMILFDVRDIIGSTPVIIGMRQKLGHIQSEKASLVAMVIMIVFLFVGEEILNLIGMDVNSFAVAGSIIIFFLALEMILGIRFYREESPETASIVPIAFPIIAWAGILANLLSLRAEFAAVNVIAAIVINILVVYIVMKSPKNIERFLGSSGISVVQKVFGVILLAIAVKLFASNVQQIFKPIG